jgi:hypothetical protein
MATNSVNVSYADFVSETTATTGTGTITLSGAVTGYQSFATAFGGNVYVYYSVVSGTAWEVGFGTYTFSGTTLARTTILASSNSGSAITLAGTSTVDCVYPASANTQNLLQSGTINSQANLFTRTVYNLRTTSFATAVFATIAIPNNQAMVFNITNVGRDSSYHVSSGISAVVAVNNGGTVTAFAITIGAPGTSGYATVVTAAVSGTSVQLTIGATSSLTMDWMFVVEASTC